MLALNRKLLRELWHLKGQVISIALVVASGIMSVVTMRGSYESLVTAQQQYYSSTRFADVWAPLVRAPLSLLPKIEAIPGVDAADSRVTFLATLDLDDSGIPAQGRFVSLPEVGRPKLNDIIVRQGRYIVPGAPDEVIVSENFAAAREFVPGDSIRVIINGRARELDIVGIGISAEHSYAVPPGALYPEDDRYGILWASREILGPAYNMDGAFNEVFVTLTPDANQDAVIDRLDNLLEPFGGLGAYPRRDQASHQILQAELDSNRVTGAAIPIIFLGVAVFLLYLVLGRMISTQRGEIAVLKAFGYTDREVGMHFLMFAVVAVLIGGTIGAIGGVYLGDAYIGMYDQYFDLPNLRYRLTPSLLVFAFFACVLGAIGGAMAAVRRAILLPPAEAMRPEAPARFKPGLFESLGLGRLLGPNGRMILRNVERKPVQGFFSSLGVAMSVAILTIGFFMFDSVNFMMDLQFRLIQREDLTLTFREILSDKVVHDLAHLDGVNRVETYRYLPARLRFGHRDEEIAIQGMEINGRLRRIVNANGNEVPVPSTGVILSSLLAGRLGVTTGDEVIVEILEGKRKTTRARVTGVIEDFLGISAYMSRQSLWDLSEEPNVISGAYLAVDDQRLNDLFRELKQVPAVTGVASPANMLQSFEDQLAEGILISAGFLLGFAAVIAVGVIYNAARISLSERGRELASLRVMGFHRREVAILLLGEQAIITLFAIPLGWLIGYSLSYAITQGIQTDIYRIPFIAEPRTYILSAILICVAAAASGLAVRRRLDRIELVEVLKTRE
ncbi:MAG: FtsX-like permease family protein [Gammaproteobacteria bacterium]|nr:FtsX-like permease family protein [Pseudomonadales bacterium]MCP5347931.1 FtsX-like permease family protein [Pseudomonadales bacterium]